MPTNDTAQVVIDQIASETLSVPLVEADLEESV